MQIRDFEALIDYRVLKVEFKADFDPFGGLLLTTEDNELLEFQLRGNALSKNISRFGLDVVEFDGFEPLKTVPDRSKVPLVELLYRLDKDAPLESTLRATAVLIRKTAPVKNGILSAVREEGEATRRAFSDTGRGLLEKVGIVPKRARWPRVSSNAKNRAAAMWKAWPETRLDAQAGGEKVDCWEFHRRELAGFGIISVEHFKAVLDKARK